MTGRPGQSPRRSLWTPLQQVAVRNAAVEKRGRGKAYESVAEVPPVVKREIMPFERVPGDSPSPLWPRVIVAASHGSLALRIVLVLVTLATSVCLFMLVA
jgi:hypothetical protein